ncbi:hypothetical protein EPUS_01726 [Endocarpon pusillum Z07020]|uniref:Aminoglycoside phosphotransferase domain-containing protein n=1 Tax=Endocarpon pusillum (strain Z07020 / HMAS-L-300199) TaxID=1263415 RepID=U1GJ02_ENDPU|nr:uncharacterized protein EPUS_01726 [Endocarpon pusillum Z07020]ERF71811.1 hypothetical protein EPUS_01726 [Endocarpon pusillum Z07020]
MDDTNDQWTSFQQLDRDSDSVHRQKVKHVLQEAEFPFLSWTAVQTRQALDPGGGSTSHTSAELLRCSIDCGRFATGHENIALELEFSDSERWMATIQLPDESSEPDVIETSMLSGIATMRLLCATTEISVPQLYGFDILAANRFWFRYMLIKPFQIAKSPLYLHMKWALSAPCSTTFTLFVVSNSGDQGGALWESAMDHCGVDARASCTIDGSGRSRYGPFPPIHVDLHHNNILFDKAFNITGIIDWSGAQTVPVERFLASPELASFPWLSTVENRRTIASRDNFAAELCVRELTTPRSFRVGGPTTGGGWSEHDMTSSPTLISDLIPTPLWDIVYRCT